MKQAVKEYGVGARAPLIDGVEKVRGVAKFTADLAIEGALVGRILRSPYSHADLLEVDVSKAGALPGVAAGVTGKITAVRADMEQFGGAYGG